MRSSVIDYYGNRITTGSLVVFLGDNASDPANVFEVADTAYNPMVRCDYVVLEEQDETVDPRELEVIHPDLAKVIRKSR